MKTTKFRAWQDNQMLHSKGGGVYRTKAFLDRLYEDCELMQFTGLKDKNDKEIYEGDIIRIKHPHKDRTFIGVVEYIDYIFGCKDFYFPHFDIPWHIFSEGTECIEIIGNIYENPEKLKS